MFIIDLIMILAIERIPVQLRSRLEIIPSSVLSGPWVQQRSENCPRRILESIIPHVSVIDCSA